MEKNTDRSNDKSKGISTLVPENYEPSPNNDHYGGIPNFGVSHLNIKEAAKWIAVDIWYSGDHEDIQEPDGFDGNVRDPRLIEALSDKIHIFETRLSSAIESGGLKAPLVQRDLNESLIPEETYVSYDDLYEWLEERGHRCGGAFEEWLDIEIEIDSLLCDEVAYLREVSKKGNKELKEIAFQRLQAKHGILDESNHSALLTAYKSALVKNQQLTEELTQIRSMLDTATDRPLHTRARRTYLAIIAALCLRAKARYEERGTAQRIKEMTEELGIPVDDKTISKILAEIPDALESRKK